MTWKRERSEKSETRSFGHGFGLAAGSALRVPLSRSIAVTWRVLTPSAEFDEQACQHRFWADARRVMGGQRVSHRRAYSTLALGFRSTSVQREEGEVGDQPEARG